MWMALTRLREPMTLAGVFTIGAVSLGLRFLPPDVQRHTATGAPAECTEGRSKLATSCSTWRNSAQANR